MREVQVALSRIERREWNHFAAQGRAFHGNKKLEPKPPFSRKYETAEWTEKDEERFDPIIAKRIAQKEAEMKARRAKRGV